MARQFRHSLLAFTALGAVLPLFAPDLGGGSGASANPVLAAALAQLDPNVDTDWNSGGQPSMDRVNALMTNGVKVTRAELVAAFPDFDRDRAKANAGTQTQSGQAAPAPDTDLGDVKVDRSGDGTVTLTADQFQALMGKVEQLGATVATLQGAASGPEPSFASKRLVKTPAKYALKWGKRVEGITMVAIERGQYDQRLIEPGQKFVFSGIPGRWMAVAGDPNLELYMTGIKHPPHVQEKDALGDESDVEVEDDELL
jgi:hypothetical protein